MRLRSGNPSGNASAVASVTTPRIPHHEITRPVPTVGNVMGRRGCVPKRRILQRITVL